MTFYQHILYTIDRQYQINSSLKSKPKPKPEPKKIEKPMKYYYFGQNRFWFYTK